jgi:tyrosine-protein phosphatase SIW14
MPRWARWPVIAFIVLVVGVVPVVHFRALYSHGKRLRVVDEGRRLYRSGQMTVEGFRDAIARLGIRTVVNLQEDFPDPDLRQSFFDASVVKESRLCRELGVKFVFIPPDLLPRNQSPPQRPQAIDRMLEVFDNPANYPLLVHCKAGLHRTGCMMALYRMEYQGWSPRQAVDEMRAHGFGDSACTAANDYVYQYVLTYRPRQEAVRRGLSSAAR